MESQKPKRNPLRQGLSILGWGLGCFFLVVFWQNLVSRQANFGQVVAGLDWRYLLVSLVLFIIGQALYLYLPYVSHRLVKFPITPLQAYRFWFPSQIAKYLPGGLWIIPARTLFYTREGMPVLVASMVVTWEVLSILAASLIMGVFNFSATQGTYTSLISVSSLVLAAGLIVSLMELPWTLLARLGLKSAVKMVETYRQIGSRRIALLAGLTLISFLVWLVIGTGFYFLSLAFGHDIGWWPAVSSYAVAWAIGFLVFLTPAGLGPREAALTVMLTPVFGGSSAFTIAILARIWWTVGETVHIVVTALMHSRDIVRSTRLNRSSDRGVR